MALRAPPARAARPAPRCSNTLFSATGTSKAGVPLGAAPRRARRAATAAAQAAPKAGERYVPPSMAPGETELQKLSSWSSLVADTVVPERVRELHGVATAAVVSHGSLMRALATPSREFEAALNGALVYDKCRAEGSPALRAACHVDKALVNLGADLASIVAGRISTEIDARLARDTPAIVAKAKRLAELYAEMGVPRERLLFRVPATWQALQAAAALEKDGYNCHAHDVYTVVQVAAAAAAGVSVIQPSVTTLQDYMAKHPNAMLPGVRGTRADAGSLHQPGAEGAAAAAGRGLVAAAAAYLAGPGAKAKQAGRCKLMAHVRTAADVRALAGTDFLLAPVPVLADLAGTSTLAGFNDGISAQAAAAAEASPLQQRAAEQAAAVAAAFLKGVYSGERADFDASLANGPFGDLLEAAVKRAADSAERAQAHFLKMWPPAGGM